MKQLVHKQQWRSRGKHLLATAFAMFMLASTPAAMASGTQSMTTTQQTQQKTIKGTVIDAATQTPVIGATVLIQGTRIATSTDANGAFTLNYKEVNPVIEVRFSGYKTFEAPIKDLTTISVSLEQDVIKIEEVTVVGYGTQRKASVIGAISTMNISDVKVPVSNISTALAGQLAGIVAVTRSGEPGQAGDFYIRGIATFGANNKPLVLVDGIERDLDLVDPEDIQTFSILKDASASAVYGVRGANGVMLITTKKGADGRPVISLSAETGIVSPTKMPKFVNSVQFANAYNDARGFSYYSQDVINMYANGTDPDLYPNVDWIGELFNSTAKNYKVNMNVSGGGAVARYYIGGSYYNEGSIYKNDSSVAYKSAIDYTKFSFRANLDVNLLPQTVLNLNLANIYSTRNAPATNDIASYEAGRTSLWGYTFNASPNAFPIKYSTGELSSPAGSGFNPYNLLTNSGYREDYWNASQSLIGITQGFEGLVDGLKFNIKYSWDSANSNSMVYQANPTVYNAYARDEFGNLLFNQLNSGTNTLDFSTAANGSRTTYVEASLTYDRAFEKHRVGGLMLYNGKVRNVWTAGSTDIIGSLPYKNQGIAARATYAYDERYFVEGNIGYNGSENFAKGQRFGFFPAGAIGWLVSNEEFMKPTEKWLTQLKVKASYGIVGNDQIGGGRRFIYNATVITDNPGYNFGMSPTGFYDGYGFAMGDIANNNVSWEEAKKFNLGIETKFFNKLSFSLDYFSEDRTGIFMQRRSIPDFAGVTTQPWVNIGQMKNKGFDANVDYHQTIGEVYVSGRANFTYAHNKLVDRDEPTPLYPYLSEIGHPYGQQFGLISEGLFKDQQEINNSPAQFGVLRPGDIKYRDINGDGKIDSNDKVAIGYGNTPEIIYGFGGTAMWRGFDIGFFFQGAANTTRMIGGGANHPFQSANLSRSAFFEDVYGNYWSESNPNVNAKYPRLSEGANSNNTQSSDFWQRDMSFLRLKSLEIGYTLPKAWLKSMQLSNLRVYVSGTNLITFSKFKVWDPEMLNNQGDGYPPSSIINIGLKVTY